VSFLTLDKIKKSVVLTLKSVVFTLISVVFPLKQTLLSVETTLGEALFLCRNECRNDTPVFTVCKVKKTQLKSPRNPLFIVQLKGLNTKKNLKRKFGSSRKCALSSSKVCAALKKQTAGRSAKSYRELGRKIQIHDKFC
jgi:hypothetical protein